uniref:Uncharacterized protein n=1 Tax=Mastacembelus armatus TaxID=205130 RepID=A0A3Q3KQI1_9TELE
VNSREFEPEWDVSSAFVANAANHIKLKGGKNRAMQISRENKENEARGRSEIKHWSCLFIYLFIMFEQGQYSQAVDRFTEAIHCDPKDHRFYGNRSYCYWCLEQYSSALADAQKSIQLAPNWPKGYFRKGSALMGLKRYSEAEKAMEQVLKLDQDCKEASSKLLTSQVLQLMELGFEERQSKVLLEKFTTVQAVIAASEAQGKRNTSLLWKCRSLWVGNITFEVTEKDLVDLFKTFGEIESIKVLYERYCAFINFKNANMAAKALVKLQVSTQTAGCSGHCPPQKGPVAPVNGDECYYWRTTGCFYGDKCRFKHIPEQYGRDKKLCQP